MHVIHLDLGSLVYFCFLTFFPVAQFRSSSNNFCVAFAYIALILEKIYLWDHCPYTIASHSLYVCVCISIFQGVQKITFWGPENPFWMKGNIRELYILIPENFNLCDFPYPINIMVLLTIILIINPIRNI